MFPVFSRVLLLVFFQILGVASLETGASASCTRASYQPINLSMRTWSPLHPTVDCVCPSMLPAKFSCAISSITSSKCSIHSTFTHTFLLFVFFLYLCETFELQHQLPHHFLSIGPFSTTYWFQEDLPAEQKLIGGVLLAFLLHRLTGSNMHLCCTLVLSSCNNMQ